jgi:hypothetical protein
MVRIIKPEEGKLKRRDKREEAQLPNQKDKERCIPASWCQKRYFPQSIYSVSGD